MENNEDLRKRYDALHRAIAEKDPTLAKEFKSYNSDLREDILTDTLTGLAGRDLFLEKGNDRLSDAIQHSISITVALLDIDNFKGVNDIRGFRNLKGYAGGDLLLARTGIVLQQCVRADDIAGRYGGEEFAIFSYDVSADDVETMANRILKRMSEYHDGETLSMGLTSRAHVDENTSLKELIAEANTALKHAKNDGKDRFVWYQPGMVDPVLPARA